MLRVARSLNHLPFVCPWLRVCELPVGFISALVRPLVLARDGEVLYVYTVSQIAKSARNDDVDRLMISPWCPSEALIDPLWSLDLARP